MGGIVLIVEDADNAVPLEIALTALHGITVKLLADGRDALALMSGDPIGVVAVITDLHLPQVDGFELVAAIRADRRYLRLPILVISGDSHPEIPSRLRNLGVDAFFPKPYSPAEIRHTLEVLLDVP